MELRDAQAQLRAAFSKCALYEASIDSLKLQLRYLGIYYLFLRFSQESVEKLMNFQCVTSL